MIARATTDESATQFDVNAAAAPLDNTEELGPRDDDVSGYYCILGSQTWFALPSLFPGFYQ